MELNATAPLKKAKYRIAELVAEIPNGRLTVEKSALAQQLDISLAQLNRIIRQDSEPSGTQLLIISQFFGCSVDDLYIRQDQGAQN